MYFFLMVKSYNIYKVDGLFPKKSRLFIPTKKLKSEKICFYNAIQLQFTLWNVDIDIYFHVLIISLTQKSLQYKINLTKIAKYL